ncbi:hypothetical protein C2845_PM01G34140 [Panicum miliaceum]|uniref:Uncharacterized protein n=1 Tax=Panicum miliaceum TaxID=4540 RepID=A0A3L6TKJ8_PANMI|nr:hypothetical protein C2845_PM01G34140 [Panicum miliaceum]
MTGDRSSAPARARRAATRPACRRHALASMTPARQPRLHPQQVPSNSPAIHPCPSHERLLLHLHAAARRSAAAAQRACALEAATATVMGVAPAWTAFKGDRSPLPSSCSRAAARRHGALRDLARRHGELVLLRLGGLPVIVASSVVAARESAAGAGPRARDAPRRPDDPAGLAIQEGAEGVIFSPYGDAWRQMRKLCTVELLSTQRIQSFRPLREEAGRLLGPPGQAVNLSLLASARAISTSRS